MLARVIFIVAMLVAMAGFARAQDAPPAAVDLLMGTPIDWKVGALAGQYVYSDQQGRAWTIRFKTQGIVEGRPKSLKMTVSGDGFKPASVLFDVADATDYGTLGVYDFDVGLPVFVMTNFTLGAHCCTDVKAVAFNGQALVATDAGTYDGSAISVRDLDGDGTYEIEGWDQRFYYAFDSYAGSLPARQILKLRDSGTADVTGNTEYQPYMIREINKWADECYDNPTPGSCAGALGTAAKAGLYQSVAAYVEFQKIDDANRNADYLGCSKERCGVEMKFWNYREALEFQLNDWGYNTDSSVNDRARRYFKTLTAFSNGFGAPQKDSESACGMSPVKFSMDKAEQFLLVQGHEYACRIEKATVLNSAAIGIGLCAAEGESYSALLMLELRADRLFMTSIDNGGMNSNAEPQALSACR